jgi:Hemerythrin HHE cation binding domain
MEQLPYVLEPLAADRNRLFAILDLLDENDDPVVRADLASELVGTCSRYEDVKARVVYPALEHVADEQDELARGEEDRQSVRSALMTIRERTLHVKPADVHWEDPEGFEAALVALVELIRIHVEHEDEILFPALGELDAATRASLRAEVEKAVVHASTYPNPPKHLFGRAVIAVIERLERGPQDEADPWHPGVELLDEALKDGETPSRK